MKSILTVVAASLLISIPSLAVEKSTDFPGTGSQFKDYLDSTQKDQCLIVAKNCVGADDTVLKRVERLNSEIEKGAVVYTPEELQQLKDQLNWIYYESDQYPAVKL
jgi:hypothetical protein